MLDLETLTIKNFLSIGNVEQIINLKGIDLTLLLGINNDMSETEARNGAGKSTLLQALSFVIFGLPITLIKKDRLINNINMKEMVVTLDFKKNGLSYRIERGRKPNFLRYIVNDNLVKAPDMDESQGESKWTQQEIERVVGMSHTLFKHIVVLHTKVRPFLDLGAKDQRDIIEELFGITALSSKAEVLKKFIKETKDNIRDEEVRIETIQSNNERINKTIKDLHTKKEDWDVRHQRKLDDIIEKISQKLEIDIDIEVSSQRKRLQFNELSAKLSAANKRISDIEKSTAVNLNNKGKIEKKLIDASENRCPCCGQSVQNDVHLKLIEDLTDDLLAIETRLADLEGELLTVSETFVATEEEISKLGTVEACSYRNLEEALAHKNILENLEKEFERENGATNPYIEQINNLSDNALQEISFNKLNELVKTKEHQDFLFKLLTSKDSFIRKKIIEQNLTFLNSRLSFYLAKLNLPHQVIFRSDLSVDIIKLGKEHDFDQLSNGEGNRVILALTWAFRDVWENEQGKLNFVAIDEMVDSGMDNSGTESALEILKSFVREQGKDVLFISHKDSLVSRVNNIMFAQKENDFTTFYEGSM